MSRARDGGVSVAPDPEAFVQGLRSGERSVVDWIARRARLRAAHRFSRWAWAWIEEDFVAELIAQLLVTVGRPGFALRSSAGAYVDTAVANLCRAYFLRIARVRSQESLDTVEPPPSRRASSTAEQVALALDLRRFLLRVGAPCRALLVRKYVLGLSLEEIAQGLGVETGTARSRLHACRTRLRELWFRDRPPRFPAPDSENGTLHGGNQVPPDQGDT